MLIKEGMKALSPYQVATLRILSAGIVLIPFTAKAIKQIPKNKFILVVLSGLIGSFFPAYLFCIAETKIDSSLAGILNALTPLFVVTVGISFFNLQITTKKIWGIIIGFLGLFLLFTSNGQLDFKNITYSAYILIATLFYGINVNLVGKHLQRTGSLNIATIAFVILIIPCLIILFYTGFFSLPLLNKNVLLSTASSSILGIMGTAIASILFYMLIKRAGALFASMVTYGIPFVAVFWGYLLHEQTTAMQLISLGIILAGVYLTNSNKKTP